MAKKKAQYKDVFTMQVERGYVSYHHSHRRLQGKGPRSQAKKITKETFNSFRGLRNICIYVQRLIKEPHTENKDKLCRHFIELVKFRYGCSCHMIASSCRNKSFMLYHSKNLLSCKKKFLTDHGMEYCIDRVSEFQFISLSKDRFGYLKLKDRT